METNQRKLSEKILETNQGGKNWREIARSLRKFNEKSGKIGEKLGKRREHTGGKSEAGQKKIGYKSVDNRRKIG